MTDKATDKAKTAEKKAADKTHKAAAKTVKAADKAAHAADPAKAVGKAESGGQGRQDTTRPPTR